MYSSGPGLNAMANCQHQSSLASRSIPSQNDRTDALNNSWPAKSNLCSIDDYKMRRFRDKHKMLRKILWTSLFTVLACASSAVEGLAGTSDSAIATGWMEIIQPPVPADNAEQQLFFESFSDALANGAIDEAETTAKKMVENAGKVDADNPSGRSRALHNLAVSQQLGGQYDAAILNYQTAVDIIVTAEGRLSPALVLPLRGLAGAHLDNEQPLKALRSYESALHVSNVNHGPHSLQQQPVLSSILQMHLDAGEANSALDVLDRIYLLNLRNHSRDSEELLPVLLEKAAVYDRLGMLVEERNTWLELTRIIRKTRGEDDIELIEPNLRLARLLIYELNKFVLRTGPAAEKHLRRALWLADNNPAVGWELRKKCLLALADYYTLVNLQGQANRYYLRVWELLASDDAYLATRAAELEATVPILQPHPYPYANFEYNPDSEKIDPQDYLDGTMTLQFTVTRRGRTQDIRIIEANPEDFVRMERRARNALKNFIYRPRYTAGTAVDTAGVQYRLEYHYRPSEYAASRAKTGKLGRPRPTKPR